MKLEEYYRCIENKKKKIAKLVKEREENKDICDGLQGILQSDTRCPLLTDLKEKYMKIL